MQGNVAHTLFLFKKVETDVLARNLRNSPRHLPHVRCHFGSQVKTSACLTFSFQHILERSGTKRHRMQQSGRTLFPQSAICVRIGLPLQTIASAAKYAVRLRITGTEPTSAISARVQCSRRIYLLVTQKKKIVHAFFFRTSQT